MKYYKAVDWNSVAHEDQKRYSYMLSSEPLSNEKLKISCDVCGAVVFDSVSKMFYMRNLTATEQRHFDSKKHQAGLTLRKLAGEKT